MDRSVQKPRVQHGDEAVDKNRDQITTDSSIPQLNQSLIGDISSDLSTSMERSDFVIDSSNQSSTPKLPISESDSTLMEDVDVSDTEMLCKTATFNVQNSDKNVIPNVPEEFKPVVGSLFVTIGECIDMYRNYAYHSGFDIRRSTEHTFRDKSVKLKYLVCHRAGIPNKRSVDSIDISGKRKGLRNSNFQVTGCKAQVRFHRVNSTSQFKLYYFNPNHNHDLLDESDRMLSRNRRQMKFSDKRLVHRAARANIGATKAHRIQVCLKGGFDEVGCSKTDYKNFKRDLDTFVGDGDVQMVVNMFNERVVNGTNFAFEFKVCEGKLQGLFWADELSRFNYSEFGHVISFDATYRSNKYVFVSYLYCFHFYFLCSAVL